MMDDNDNNNAVPGRRPNDDEDDDGGGSSMSLIRPIEAESVRRIVAGQAVTDLASAVKELVDNSLDAGSKSINSKSLKYLRWSYSPPGFQ